LNLSEFRKIFAYKNILAIFLDKRNKCIILALSTGNCQLTGAAGSDSLLHSLSSGSPRHPIRLCLLGWASFGFAELKGQGRTIICPNLLDCCAALKTSLQFKGRGWTKYKKIATQSHSSE
jgi:hypothetical protein